MFLRRLHSLLSLVFSGLTRFIFPSLNERTSKNMKLPTFLLSPPCVATLEWTIDNRRDYPYASLKQVEIPTFLRHEWELPKVRHNYILNVPNLTDIECDSRAGRKAAIGTFSHINCATRKVRLDESEDVCVVRP